MPGLATGSAIERLPAHLHHVLQAVHALYYDPDPQAKKQADQALKEFQKTKQAWQISHDILQLSHVAPEAVWFAANTLYNKVSFAYSDLGPNDRFPFRDAVLSHLSRHIKGTEIILTQLALSVAALAVQMQEWDQPVDQLVTMLNGGHGDTAHALLHILTVLPEECDTISRRYRHAGPRALSLCTSVGAKVLALLSEFLRRSNDQRIHRMVLRCLLSWVRYAFAAVPESAVLSSTILGDCFQAVSCSEICDIACDVISAFIIFAEQHSLDSLRQQLAAAVFQLWPRYCQLVNEGDSSQCRNILQVFMQLAESNVIWILDETAQAEDILKLVVNCIPNPDPELSILTFNFWYILAGNMEALSRGDPARAARIGPRYQQYFTSAIDNIRVVIEFPSDYDGLSEQDEEQKRFRYAAADALLDISSFFNSAVCLEHLVSCMQPLIAQYRTSPAHWHKLEACLYSIRSIARNIQISEENTASKSLLPRVMADLLSMTSHPVLRYTATMIIGRYSDWINAHPESIGPLLSFVVQGLNVSGTQSAAAMAFKFICESCSKNLASGPIDQLIQVYCSMGNLDIDDQNEIIEGVCAVVCARPSESIPDHLKQLINPILQTLSAMMNLARSGSQIDHAQLSASLDRLAHLFKSIHLDSCPELVAMVNEMWPLLRDLLVSFVQEEKLMEKVCRLIKFALRATRTDFPVLKELLTLMIQLYPIAPWSCFIYTCAITVDEFSSLPQHHELFPHVISAIGAKSLSLLSSIELITDNPTICEDYFNFLSRCATDLTGMTLQSGLLEPSFTCAVHAVRIQHREAARAVFMFLRHILDLGQTRAECQGPVQVLFDSTGRLLFQALISHLLEDLSRNRMRDLVEVIRAAVNLDKNKSRVYLQQALDMLPPTVPCRTEFMGSLFSASSPAEQRDAILKFESTYQEANHLL